ncbi:MAG: cytidylate kinase-like family protein [Oribacterium sp.]|nr:cytidylate kinase-like family protein [Oribacterium sp.]
MNGDLNNDHVIDEKDIRILAEEIYDLDERVYKALGSGLGRVYNYDRDRSVKYLMDILETPGQDHTIRAEIALIGNMARTIPEKGIRHEIMTEYDTVMKRFQQVSATFTGVKDKKRAGLNELNSADMSWRFKGGHHLIICISRTYGSGGNSIGLKIADKLHINFYDREIFNAVLRRMEVEQDHEITDDMGYEKLPEGNESSLEISGVNANDPAPSFTNKKLTFRDMLRKLNRYHGLPTRDALFFNMSDLIIRMAKEQDFVVMGRCADQILSNAGIPHVSIFITAPFKIRVSRMMAVDQLDYHHAKKKLKNTDRKHAEYYQYFTGKKWGDSNNYDLCINTSSYGINGSVNFILNMLGYNK